MRRHTPALIALVVFSVLCAASIIFRAPIEQARADWRTEHCRHTYWQFFCGYKP